MEEQDRTGNKNKTGSRSRLKKVRIHPLRIIVGLVLLGVAVIAIIAWFTYRDEIDHNTLRRLMSYVEFDLGSSDDEGEAEVFDTGGRSRYAPLGEGLAALWPGGLEIFNGSGKNAVHCDVSMRRPALECAGGVVVAYDRGGTSFVVADMGGVRLEDEAGGAILSVRVNSAGWFVMVSEKRQYKAVVTVYDGAQKPVFHWYSATRYVLDAVLSPDCRRLCVLFAGEENGAFVSNVSFFDIEREEGAFISHDYMDMLVLSVYYIKDGFLCAVAEDRAIYFTDTGAKFGEFDFKGRFLKNFACSAELLPVFLLSQYKGGGRLELVQPDRQGYPLHMLTMDEEALGLSAAGGVLSILTPIGVRLYDVDLRQIAVLPHVEGTRAALAREDGSVLLVLTGKVEIYRP